MIKNLSRVLVVAATLSFPGFAYAQAEAAAGYAANAAVSGIIENLKNSIRELIERLDNSVSARSFQIRTELSFLLNEVEHTGLTLVDKSFGQLNQSQQVFFDKTSGMIAQARSLTDDALAQTADLANQIEQVVASVPFSSEEPRLRSVSPLFLETAKFGEEGEIALTMTGSFLHHGGASLVIANTPCRLLDHLDNRISFGCPKKLFVWEAGIEYVTGLLTVRDDASFWDRVKEYFGNYKPEKQYAVVVTVVPRRLGSYTINAVFESPVIEKATRTGAWGRTAEHCRENPGGTNNFGVQAPGWIITPDSIQLALSCSRHGGGHAVRNFTPTGFQVDWWTKNSGKCVDLWVGKSYDARGCEEGTVSWLETRQAPRNARQDISVGELYWGTDVPIQLPSRTVGFTVTVTQLNGRTVVLNSGSPSKWFDVQRDAQSTSLVIRPKPLAEAMRN